LMHRITAQVSELLSLWFLCAWVPNCCLCFGPSLDSRRRLLNH
jgi:hypothetical protein